MGDMLSRLTNNRLLSTIHRVINPPKKDCGKSRYSIPFFMHPLSKMPLNCLPETIDKNHPKKFDDITAGEFLQNLLCCLWSDSRLKLYPILILLKQELLI